MIQHRYRCKSWAWFDNIGWDRPTSRYTYHTFALPGRLRPTRSTASYCSWDEGTLGNEATGRTGRWTKRLRRYQRRDISTERPSLFASLYETELIQISSPNDNESTRMTVSKCRSTYTFSTVTPSSLVRITPKRLGIWWTLNYRLISLDLHRCPFLWFRREDVRGPHHGSARTSSVRAAALG